METHPAVHCCRFESKPASKPFTFYESLTGPQLDLLATRKLEKYEIKKKSTQKIKLKLEKYEQKRP